MEPFSVSGVYIGLALGTLPCNLQHWGWNLKICGSFWQFFQAFGAPNFSIQVLWAQQLGLIECIKPWNLQHVWFLVMQCCR